MDRDAKGKGKARKGPGPSRGVDPSQPSSASHRTPSSSSSQHKSSPGHAHTLAHPTTSAAMQRRHARSPSPPPPRSAPDSAHAEVPRSAPPAVHTTGSPRTSPGVPAATPYTNDDVDPPPHLPPQSDASSAPPAATSSSAPPIMPPPPAVASASSPANSLPALDTPADARPCMHTPSPSAGPRASNSIDSRFCTSASSTMGSSAARPSASTATPLPPPPAPPPEPDTPHTLEPSTVLPLLRCPICAYDLASSSAALAPTDGLLEQPVTLRCGHTLCASHLSPPSPTRPPCPLPTCASRTGRAERDISTLVHPDARVGFVPAPPEAFPPEQHEDAAGDAPEQPERRADVLVQKVVALVRRAVETQVEEGEEIERLETLDETDDEDEHDHDQDKGKGDADDDTGPVAGPSSLRRPHSPVGTGRPRKRRRLARGDAPPRPARRDDGPGAFEKELLAELTCEICFALLWQPVTTPCQHTFCARCLHRTMDHSLACPICRQALPGYAYFQDQPCNKVVLSLISNAFPAQYAERGATIEAEERDARLDTPILVAQLSFPDMPTMLHLFEPRYRLMLRRCLATPHPAFGMIPPPRAQPLGAGGEPGNDYGTMLEIRTVQMLPDGRSIVETWGTHRFRIMERGTLDGYTVGRIERVEDLVDEEADATDIAAAAATAVPTAHAPVAGGAVAPVAGPSGAAQPGVRLEEPRHAGRGGATNAELMAVCRDFLEELTVGTPWVGQHLNQSYVPMPADAARFSFWMALLLPIPEHEKAKLLPIRSPRLRLRLVVHWIDQLRSNWSRAYASASPAQVVLWWLYALLTRLVPLRPPAVLHPAMLGVRARRRVAHVRYAGWLVVGAAVLWAQLGLWTGAGVAHGPVQRERERR